MRAAAASPAILVALLVAAIMLFLVVMPLAQLAMSSLEDGDTQAFTLANYASAFGRYRYVEAIINSAGIAAAAALLSVAMAVPLAWGVVRTDMPARALVHLGVIATFLVPPLVGAIAWTLLAGPNAGWLNRAWSWLTGQAGPFDIYSFWGLSFVIATYGFPLIYVYVAAALGQIPADMEEAAQIHGARTLRVLLRVTLPLALPSIIGGTLLVLLEALTLYGAPALIGIPAGINTISTQLVAFFSSPVRLEVACAYAVPLLAAAAALLGLQRLVLARRGFVTVTGKAAAAGRTRIGGWGYLLVAYAALVCTLSVVLPSAILLGTSFSKAWAVGFAPGNFTLDNFVDVVLRQATVRDAIWNTLAYSALAATGCTLLGFILAYAVGRRLLPFGPFLGFLAVSPAAIPGIVLAVCFYAAYAAPPLALYGSGTLVVVAFVTRFLPIAFVSAAASVRGLNAEMEEAANMLGTGPIRTVRLVVLPLLKKALLGSWVLIFIIATRELSTAVFLTGPKSRVMSVLMMDLSEQGRFETLSAMSLLVLVITALVVLAASKSLGRDFMVARD